MSCVTSGKKAQVCSEVQRKLVWNETSAFQNGGKKSIGRKMCNVSKKISIFAVLKNRYQNG